MKPEPAVWMTALRWTARTGSIASGFILVLFFPAGMVIGLA
jgi:hypothetical protein